MKDFDAEKFNRSLEQMIDNKHIFSAAMKVESGCGKISWSNSAGSMQVESKYFIASVTKLYITAVVLQMINEGKITPDDKISNHLPNLYCDRLHVYKGVDYSDQLTIHHLITNTSGIPDYFFHKQASGSTVADELMAGNDEPWPLERTLELIKNLKPKFRPGAKGKAAYSDSNYQLLGKIIETVTGKSIGMVLNDYIFAKLGLQNTFVYSDPDDTSPVPFYYGSKKLWLPNYMTSIGPEGGIVSTVDEVMVFLKAFFNGGFFSPDQIDGLKKWNMIYPPPGLFCFGVGLEKLWIPKIASPLKYPGEILGFWGQTGSFAFHNPKTNLYFCGTTNQINGKGHRKATGMMIKAIKSMI